MRTLTAIGGFIVGAIAIDVGLGLLNPDRLLPARLCATIGDWGMTASLFVIPALFIFTPATPPHKRSLGLRIPLAILASWFATLEFRMQFNLPALRELARQRDDYMYDGVGMNAALLVMGWLLPLIATLLMVAMLQCAIHWRRRPDGVVADSDDTTNATAENAT
ncbi:hypothetical protein [Rhodopirellula halodulae]|uniref:hypothetical protein n=1 Tax=Rhodopirellula halodulae TaxID=2894198 RepID=UPI001E3351A0|nr:hypothetical protein [Rhodopirellula sp. JC737]MCC9656736.1 hypothetical protein [Rhodopirellula sp. JC737]